MKEAYVKLETAKLLKEKGFDWDTDKVYERSIMACRYEDYPMPTQQMACRWLREEHNILVCILPFEVVAGVMNYTFCIYRIHGDDYYFEPRQGRIKEVMDYEKAIEAGLWYVLKNLI